MSDMHAVLPLAGQTHLDDISNSQVAEGQAREREAGGFVPESELVSVPTLFASCLSLAHAHTQTKAFNWGI